jgi:hypothetical protein
MLRNSRRRAALALVAVLAGCEASDTTPCYCGRVADAVTGRPINGAFVTVGTGVERSDYLGRFRLPPAGVALRVRAYGYLRAEVAPAAVNETTPILLRPFAPKALYLSIFGVGEKPLRESALRLIRETELNALVIDVKGDRGFVGFRSAVPLAREAGAQKTITIRNLPALVHDLHARGVYLIARVVVFKDDKLANARPDLAAKTAQGAVWKDREGLAWTNPFNPAVWNYNIDIAIEAARAGFDEIQFDYVRFPDRYGLAYGGANTQARRVGAIGHFLSLARARLAPYDVFLAADIFGYVAWNPNDTYIGQQIESLAKVVDYVSPMLYPSGFQFGIPGYRNPVQHPREVVLSTLDIAQRRTALPAVRFRPWLQAFPDYAFGGRIGGAEIRTQIDAAEQFGSDGWMLWNPRNVYTRQGLKARH